jgi:hypothetical protein
MTVVGARQRAAPLEEERLGAIRRAFEENGYEMLGPRAWDESLFTVIYVRAGLRTQTCDGGAGRTPLAAAEAAWSRFVARERPVVVR